MLGKKIKVLDFYEASTCIYRTEISVFHTLRFNFIYSTVATVHWWKKFAARDESTIYLYAHYFMGTQFNTL